MIPAIIAFVVSWGGKAWSVLVAAWGWTRRHPVATPWILCGLLLALLVAQHWNGVQRLAAAGRAAAARLQAEQDASAKGLEVVRRAKQAEVDAAVGKVKDLQAALDAAQLEVGRLTTRYVVHAETAGAPVRGARPGEPPAPPGPALPAVVLRDGDPLKIVVDGAIVEGAAGAETVHGFGEARTPDGRTLTRQPFSAAATVIVSGPKAVCPAPPEDRKWRAGPVGGMTTRGWEVGAAGTRRVDIAGYKPEGFLLLHGGPDNTTGRQGDWWMGLAGGLLF